MKIVIIISLIIAFNLILHQNKILRTENHIMYTNLVNHYPESVVRTIPRKYAPSRNIYK